MQSLQRITAPCELRHIVHFCQLSDSESTLVYSRRHGTCQYSPSPSDDDLWYWCFRLTVVAWHQQTRFPRKRLHIGDAPNIVALSVCRGEGKNQLEGMASFSCLRSALADKVRNQGSILRPNDKCQTKNSVMVGGRKVRKHHPRLDTTHTKEASCVFSLSHKSHIHFSGFVGSGRNAPQDP